MIQPRPNILYVHAAANVSPFTGVHQRIINIARLLSDIGNVTMVTLGQAQHPQAQHVFEAEFGSVTFFRPVPVADNCQLIRKCRLFSPWAWADQVCSHDRRTFETLANKADIIWFHSLPAADAFGRRAWPRAVIDLDDLNAEKLRLRAERAESVRHKWADHLLAGKWRRREHHALKRFAVVIVCSQADRSLLGNADNVCVIPNGFQRPKTQPEWTAQPQNRLGFIGTLDYLPNADSLCWFHDEVWPIIRRQNPDTRLRIVGKTPQQQPLPPTDGFDVLGQLDDVADEFATWSAMIAPVRFAGGIRIKIIEAFSRMCPVVATTTAAYGLDITADRDICLADTPEQFAQSCLAMLEHPETAAAMTEAAYQLFDEKYAWDRMAPAVEQAVQRCLQQTAERTDRHGSS